MNFDDLDTIALGGIPGAIVNRIMNETRDIDGIPDLDAATERLLQWRVERRELIARITAAWEGKRA